MPDGSKAEFAYDPFARRVSKRLMRPDGLEWKVEQRTRFVWDGDLLVHEIREEARQSGDPVVTERTYCFEDLNQRARSSVALADLLPRFVAKSALTFVTADLGAAPIAHREVRLDGGRKTGEWLHYLNDPVGAPERLLTGDGAVAGELRRSAWGVTEAAGERARTPIRFQGQYEDEETGLFYNRFRYYDPATARFVSRDPIELRGGAVQLFSYVPDPTRWIDPLGLAFGIPTLTPPADPTAGVGQMNGQAVKHLLDARAQGATPAEMADMYDGMKKQIEAEAINRKQQWSASRGTCTDGSHVFLGSKGPALAITPTRQIATGTALGGPNNLIDVSKPSIQNGKLVFPAPNLAAASKVL